MAGVDFTGAVGSVTGMSRRTELGNLIRAARGELGMSQDELGAVMGGRSRQWVSQLERGERYGGGGAFEVSAGVAVQLALVLDLDPVDVLRAAGVPESQWPNLSNVSAKNGKVKTIDITTLSTNQARIIEDLVDEFKAGNQYYEWDK